MSQRREERGARIEREGARRERRDEGSGVRSAGRAQADAEVGDDRGEREARGVVAGVVEDALDAAVEEDEVGVRAREEGLERLVADRALGRGVGVERERPPHAGLATATRHATTTRAEGLREGASGDGPEGTGANGETNPATPSTRPMALAMSFAEVPDGKNASTFSPSSPSRAPSRSSNTNTRAVDARAPERAIVDARRRCESGGGEESLLVARRLDWQYQYQYPTKRKRNTAARARPDER